MKTKFILIFLLIGIFTLSTVRAYYTEDHLYWTLKGMAEVDSPITQQCKPYIHLMLDGNTAADAEVIHYFDNQFMSYVFTHTKGGFEKCMQAAGTSPELQCLCYGIALHQVQDRFAHLEDGIVPRYLQKSYTVNLLGHMIIEQQAENKMRDLIRERNENFVADGKWDFYNTHVLCSFFTGEEASICEGFNGGKKYENVLEEAFSFQIDNDIRIFQMGYLEVGFLNSVYKDRVSLPPWFWGVCIALIMIGLTISILAAVFGKTGWKWLVFVLFLLVAIVGSYLLYAILHGNVWSIITQGVQIPTTLGLMKISNQDIITYDAKTQEATNKFLETGILPYSDVSGLSYEKDGEWVVGALNKAETMSKYILMPVVLMIFLVSTAYLFYKTFA